MKRSELVEGMEVHVTGYDYRPMTVVSTKPWYSGRRALVEVNSGSGVLVEDRHTQRVVQLGQMQPWGPWKAEHDEQKKIEESRRARLMAKKERAYAREAAAEIAAEKFGIDRFVHRAYNEHGEGQVKVDARLFEAMLNALPEGFTFEPEA